MLSALLCPTPPTPVSAPTHWRSFAGYKTCPLSTLLCPRVVTASSRLLRRRESCLRFWRSCWQPGRGKSGSERGAGELAGPEGQGGGVGYERAFRGAAERKCKTGACVGHAERVPGRRRLLMAQARKGMELVMKEHERNAVGCECLQGHLLLPPTCAPLQPVRPFLGCCSRLKGQGGPEE